MTAPLRWTDITPADALDINLSVRTDITAPVNEEGQRCPWPWEPQQLVGVPIGQYHCPWCGAMVMAGMAHLDYACTADPPCEHPITAHEPDEGLSGDRWTCLAPDCGCVAVDARTPPQP